MTGIICFDKSSSSIVISSLSMRKTQCFSVLNHHIYHICHIHCFTHARWQHVLGFLPRRSTKVLHGGGVLNGGFFRWMEASEVKCFPKNFEVDTLWISESNLYICRFKSLRITKETGVIPLLNKKNLHPRKSWKKNSVMASGDPLFSSFFGYFSFAACGLCFLHLSEGAALGIPKKLLARNLQNLPDVKKTKATEQLHVLAYILVMTAYMKNDGAFHAAPIISKFFHDCVYSFHNGVYEKWRRIFFSWGRILFSWLRICFSWRRIFFSWRHIFCSWRHILFSWRRICFSWRRVLFSWRRICFSWRRIFFSWRRICFSWRRTCFSWRRICFSWRRIFLSWWRICFSWGRICFSWRRICFSWRRICFSWRRILFSWRRIFLSWRRICFSWLRICFSMRAYTLFMIAYMLFMTAYTLFMVETLRPK